MNNDSFEMNKIQTTDGRVLHNCTLSVDLGDSTKFTCHSSDQVFGKEVARTKSHFAVGAVVDSIGGGRMIGYRTPFHARVAATVALIRQRNPDWFEHRFLKAENDVLFYDNSRSSRLRYSKRADSRKLETEMPVLQFSRRGSRCIWIDCQALAEANRKTNGFTVKHNGRTVFTEYEDWDREKRDYFPFSEEKETELKSRWTGRKDDIVTYHHEATRLVRRTFDRVIRCRKHFDGVDSDLPGGWVEVTVERQKGEASDKYYISPGGHCFRSTVEVQRFLRYLPKVNGSERSAAILAEDTAASDSKKLKSQQKR